MWVQPQINCTRKPFSLLLIVFLSPSLVSADDDHHHNSTRWIGFLIIAVSLIFLIITAAIAAYIRRTGMLGATAEEVARPQHRGLEAAEVESLPSLHFSEIKMHRRVTAEENEQTCAVCLIEFQDSDILRLLPDCCHVFHYDCIPAWLASHVTCPMCRASLEYRQGSGVSKSSVLDRLSSGVALSEASDYQHDHLDDHPTVDMAQECRSLLEPLIILEYNRR